MRSPEAEAKLLSDWRKLKWVPHKEKLTDFVIRFRDLVKKVGCPKSDEMIYFRACMPKVFLDLVYLCKSIPEAVDEIGIEQFELLPSVIY